MVAAVPVLVLTVYEDVPVFGTAQCILSADNLHCLGPVDFCYASMSSSSFKLFLFLLKEKCKSPKLKEHDLNHKICHLVSKCQYVTLPV